MTYLRPSEAEILFWDNHPNCEMHKRFFDDNSKTYALRALKMSWVHTHSTIAATFNPKITYLRPSEAEILFWDNHPHRELHKRFFDDNSKNYALRALKMSWVPTHSTIAATFNPKITYLRPSEAEILFWDNHPHRELHKRFLTITRRNNAIRLGNGLRTH